MLLYGGVTYLKEISGEINFFLKKYLFYVNLHFTCMHVCMRVPDPLELKFQTIVIWHMCSGN